MEKYAIDIDKVLDEFEENEAQETSIIKPVVSSKRENIRNYNEISQCVEKLPATPRMDDSLLAFSINSETFDNQLNQNPDDCIDKQNKNLKYLLGSSTLSNSNVGESLEKETSERCYSCSSDDKEDISNFAYNKDSKLLNFDIFYKPVDSSNFSNHVISTDSYPSIVNTVTTLENECNLEDEVLCVSVHEISPKFNNTFKSESPQNEFNEFTATNTIQRSETMLSSESLKSYDLNGKNYIVNPESVTMPSNLEVEKCVNNDGFLKYSEQDYISPNYSEHRDLIQTTVLNISLNSPKDETLEKCKENSPSKVTSKFMTQLSVNDSQESSTCASFITNSYSFEKNLDKPEMILSKPEIPNDSVNVECLAAMNDSASTCIIAYEKVEILKEDDCVSSYSKMGDIDKSSIPSRHSASNILSDSNIGNQSFDSHEESCAQDFVPVVNFDKNNSSLMSGEQRDLDEAVSVKDNLYAPSSELWKVCEIEHIYDSPNISQDDDSGVSSQEDISGNSPSEVPDNQSSSSSNTVQFGCNLSESGLIKNCQDVKTSIKDTVSSFQSNKCEEIKSFNLNETSHMPSNATLNSEEDISCTGARPKIDHPVLNNVSKEKFSSNEDVLSPCDVSTISNDLTTQGSSNKLKSSTLCLENELDVSSPSVVSDSEITDGSLLFNTSNVLDVKEEVSKENTVLETDGDIKVDELSLRLQRPTSLNLPSVQLPPAEVIVEEGLYLDHESSEQLVENGSLVTPIDELTPEVPCVKQQHQIGFIRPYWIPDSEAANCMHCAMKFTVIRRRHHCRACGKVLCSRCCNQRAHLAYMNKEDRICQPCAEILTSGYNTMVLQNDHLPVSSDSLSISSGSSPNFSDSVQTCTKPGDKTVWRPHPNNPDDYCSTIPPLQQMELSGPNPPPTVMVPIGVLKRGNKRRREPKQVIFSDGIRPGGDLTDLTEPLETAPVYRRAGRKRMDKIISDESNEADSPFLKAQQKSSQKRFLVSDGEGPLPPIVLQLGHEDDENVDWSHIFQILQDEEQKAVKFILLKNLHIFVKLTKLDCCYGKECWCFTSCGFCSVGQDEIMIILEKTSEETSIPRDIFKLFTLVYDNACKGTTVEDLGHVIFPEKILDSTDHRGFLFVRPTFQCLSKLTVPSAPYLIAILIHKWEVPWAKVFPLRLMLRLGAECRYYPCSLVSVRNRKPVFFEIGQTIMSVLADLRNYQFTLPVIPGIVVHMEEKKTCVNIPRNRYDKIMKVLKTNNVEHVLPLGSNFSTEADSHLVCMQKEEGDYQTQAINIENTVRKGK